MSIYLSVAMEHGIREVLSLSLVLFLLSVMKLVKFSIIKSCQSFVLVVTHWSKKDKTSDEYKAWKESHLADCDMNSQRQCSSHRTRRHFGYVSVFSGWQTKVRIFVVIAKHKHVHCLGNVLMDIHKMPTSHYILLFGDSVPRLYFWGTEGIGIEWALAIST